MSLQDGRPRENRAASLRPSRDSVDAFIHSRSGWSPSVLISVLFVEEPKLLGLVTEWDGSGTRDFLDRVHVEAQLGRVALVAVTLGTSAADGGSCAHNTSVDAARDAVGELDVDLGQLESVLVAISGVLGDISARRAVDHLAHLEALNGLILGDAAGAVDAPDDVGVTLVLLPSSVVPSL